MTCPLCQREPKTHCYHEDELVWVVDCSSCGTPMIVWKDHVEVLTPADNQHVCQVLYDLFGHFEVDGIRRTHPDHWHAHLRGEEGVNCPADNPVDSEIVSHLSRREVELLDKLEAEMLAAGAAATAAYEAGDFATAELEDARYVEMQEKLEAISAEVLEGGTPQVGGSEEQEGFGLDVTQFLARTWAEYLRYQRTGWASGGLDLSNLARLAEYLRLNLRYDLVEGVTDTQLLEAAEDAYNARIGYFERGVRRRQMEDRVLAKLGDLDAQRRLYRDEDQARRDLEQRQRRRLSGNPGGLLQLRTARHGGWLFETGVPVTFKAMRSTEPAPWFGARFGQDLEPAGTYMLVDANEAWKVPTRSWVYFEQHFSNPLVIATVADDDSNTPIYGPLGWKRRLTMVFGGATGAVLSRTILAAGHDGIVTVGPASNDVREVIDLTRLPRSAALQAKKNPLDPDQVKFLQSKIRAVAGDYPVLLILRDRLLELGGEEIVVNDGTPADLDRFDYLNLGRVWDGKGALLERGKPIDCHGNVARMWRSGKLDAIGTGYALSDDGLWRQHSWGFRNGRLIETTVLRDLYFGLELKGFGADLFAKPYKKNPLDPEAWASESQPCALARPMGPCPDDREGVHFALSWGLAARYALFKAGRSGSIGIVLTYDLAGLPLEPDHDAVIEKSFGDYMVREISYYIDEFDILEDPDSPDYERLADLMEGEAESESEGREPMDYSIEQQLVQNAKGSIFMLLADRLRDPWTQEQALAAIRNADVPKGWWAEAICQMRTFSVVGDERLLRVQALKPVHPDIGVGDEPDEVFDESACPALLTIEDMDFNLADVLEGMAVTLWESPEADQVVEPYFHGTDLTRAEVILEEAPAAAELRNPWEPCTQP